MEFTSLDKSHTHLYRASAGLQSSSRTYVEAALFTTAKIWKQPKGPSTDEWIKNMWYIHIYIHTHTIHYYSAIKKNKTLLLAATWMDL